MYDNNDDDDNNNNNKIITIPKPGILCNTIEIKTLSRDPGNNGLAVSPVRCKLPFMGDFDDIQCQPILQYIADDTMVPLHSDY